MRHIITLVLLFSFTATAHAGWFSNIFGGKKADTNETVLQQTTSSGETMTVVLTGEEFVKVDNVRSIEGARKSCFDSRKATSGLSDVVGGMEQMRLALTAPDCGSGYADALIAVENRKLGQTKVRWGAFSDVTGGVLKTAAGVYLGGEAIDGAVSLGTAALSAAGSRTTITASGESNISLTGNVGEGNSFNNEGIPVNPADLATLTTANEEADEMAEMPEIDGVCVDLRPVLDRDPEGLDANGDGFVCSDGEGGATDN